MMKVNEFIEKLKLAERSKTLYVKGGFGAPAGYKTNRTRYSTNNKYNKAADRAAMIKNCSSDTFFFDCVCLGKGILWGWNADTNAVYGGAKYTSGGVPDFAADSAMNHCSDVSTDFSKIEVGEWLWMSGHVGYYVGDGMVIECTPSWENRVQYTKLTQRKWKKHGKCKYIDYTATNSKPVEIVCPCCGATFQKVGG